MCVLRSHTLLLGEKGRVSEKGWPGGSYGPCRALTVAWTQVVAVERGGSRCIQDTFWRQNEQVLPKPEVQGMGGNESALIGF